MTVRIVVVGASSGLGRCIGIGLAQRGAHVALLARRLERLEAAAKEAGGGALALECDVTSTESCQSAITEAAAQLGGIDALVYGSAVAPLAALADTDAQTWRQVFDTNVLGAALVTTAALPHLSETSGIAVYLSSWSASLTAPWPGLGAYLVSKAALDKLVEAWRVEHPAIGFTRLIVGNCGGGEGDGAPELASGWDPEIAGRFAGQWIESKYLGSTLLDVDELVSVVDRVVRSSSTTSVPSIAVMHRDAPTPMSAPVIPTPPEWATENPTRQ